MTANAAELLIQHYVDNFRRLPWRSPPGAPAPDPYRVWLSEVMLQQTSVATVQSRFARFLARWPTVEALAAAEDKDVFEEWAGLGYYARARNLLACAREVALRGGFPRTSEELEQLAGVGRYTAAAIAAIAFGERSPAIDTNVRRILARLNGLEQPSPAQLEGLLLELLPVDQPGDFIQALMDLGASICRARKPRCGECVLADHCAAAATGEPEKFPRRAPRPVRPHRHGIAYWVERDGKLWLVRRPKDGLLGGMAALPGGDWTQAEPRPSAIIGKVRHVFSHFSLDLYLVPRAEPQGEGWWQSLEQLERAGLPTLYRKAVQTALSSNGPVNG